MPIEVWLPLFLTVVSAAVYSARSVATQGARAVELLTQLKEKVSICQVGIEALRMVDTDTSNRMGDLEQKVEDLERYLELASAGQYPHPYTPRGKGKRPPKP
ncbi:hypothetical protein PGN35_025290 [Nodosilinea sp. PGN35]|uniref:hypothetical protein n=1 Tax=Nodosilinea sp. PGN35 TaxID=3020489 RepID=UPI0023B26DFF|nr:hypothetical protein [Nodosilinea sp. TSF1-S3]MDF0367450.1 hypothetical protein [Nodosilinea sp. TSF1-S3]